MNILDAILGAQGGAATERLGQQFGLDQSQVSSALSALVPALAAGARTNMSSPDGGGGLLAALAGGQHQRYIDDPNTLSHPDSVTDGNAILGQIFGSKDVSRQVASQVSSQTGIGENVLKSMLPVVAALMMGSMSKQAAQSPGVQAGDMSGVMSMLDTNKDGSVMDDILGFIGKFTSRRTPA